jgi:ABC-type antimicrobial peptide transport system permease subunit
VTGTGWRSWALWAMCASGVLSYTVARRTREIGVRMSLGAQSRDVMELVLGAGLRRVLAGIAVGLGAGFALTQFLGSLLFGVGTLDFASFAGASCILILVAVAACYLPAASATRIDPMRALRQE